MHISNATIFTIIIIAAAPFTFILMVNFYKLFFQKSTIYLLVSELQGEETVFIKYRSQDEVDYYCHKRQQEHPKERLYKISLEVKTASSDQEIDDYIAKKLVDLIQKEKPYQA